MFSRISMKQIQRKVESQLFSLEIAAADFLQQFVFLKRSCFAALPTLDKGCVKDLVIYCKLTSGVN